MCYITPMMKKNAKKNLFLLTMLIVFISPIIFKNDYTPVRQTEKAVAPAEVTKIMPSQEIKTEETNGEVVSGDEMGDKKLRKKYKYGQLYEEKRQKYDLPHEVIDLLIASENPNEDPEAEHYNRNGTVDVGLFQISVPVWHTEKIKRMKNPEENTEAALLKFSRELKILKDLPLTIAAYNMGMRGATKYPDKTVSPNYNAMNRIKWVYERAGLPLPESEFVSSPCGYIKKIEQDLWKLKIWSADYGD